MLGFTLPLLVFGGLEGLVAADLLLPLPLSRPAIWLCKQSKSQIGRTVVFTIAAVLLVMLAAPLYDILHLHDRPEATAGVNIERRETEATANLGAVLTGSTLVTMFVLRKLGLALAEIDDMTAGGATKVHSSTVNSAFDTKDQ